MKSVFAAGLIAALKMTVFPDLNLLIWVFLAVGLDFVTGIAKAYVQGVKRTSERYRKTIVKAVQYGGAIIVGIILATNINEDKNTQLSLIVDYLNNGLLIFIIYIECTSVFENLYAMDKKSKLSKYFIKPVLSLLTFQLEYLNEVVENKTDENK